MITNERQYRITKSEAQKFAASVAKFDAQPPTGLHPLLVKAQRDALVSQLEELQEEILEYETLRNSGQIGLDLGSILELPKALIKARVALGLTQKQLAERLRLKEQQVQQYESTFYNSANLKRVMQVAQILSQVGSETGQKLNPVSGKQNPTQSRARAPRFSRTPAGRSVAPKAAAKPSTKAQAVAKPVAKAATKPAYKGAVKPGVKAAGKPTGKNQTKTRK